MLGRSTVLQLLTVIDRWTEIFDKGGAVDVAYCDFMKAFDKVSHRKLIHKLKKYNLGEKYINWIAAFLKDRKQKVLVNGESSDWKDVLSGILQSSVLGPTLLCYTLMIYLLPYRQRVKCFYLLMMQRFIEAYLKAQIVKNYKWIYIYIYIVNAWSEK